MYFDDNANGIFDSCESPISDYEFVISDGFADYNIKTTQTGEWSLTVEAGDAIKAQAATASKVTVVVNYALINRENENG